MKNDDEVVGEAVRIEYTEHDGRLFLVFEITKEKYKQDIKKNWMKDVEYRLVDKCLVKEVSLDEDGSNS
jgi:hypothetical protein